MSLPSLLAAVFALLSGVTIFAQTISDSNEWQDATVFGINKLPPRNAAWPNPDADSGWKSDYDHSPWVKSLNGLWSFSWAKDPDSRIKNFYEPSFDATAWKKIPVPSVWELEGFKIEPLNQPNYGIPIYTNSNYPFDVSKPPLVMNAPRREYTSFEQRNPVGSYRTTFEVPADWKGGRTLLHFGGVYSAMYIWVNGQKVGFSENSRSPAEFDITPYLKVGSNLLAVEVYRWSDGSYLEDQDMWRMSGIYRDVFLYHTPDVTLWDFYVDTDLDSSYKDGFLGLYYTLRNSSDAAVNGLKIRLSLRGPDGKLVGNGPLLEQDAIAAPGFDPEKMIARVPVKSPLLWTNETPNVYEALVELVQDGKVIESRRTDIGFRKIELKDKQYLVNGVPIKMKGVNRHESSPTGGYTIDLKSMEKDLALIKQANLNFVRTSHYSNDPRWYELCNRWGLFVLDEVNLETHGLSYHKKILPGDDPLWEPAVVDRMQRMVIGDRNNPSVVMWSLGNEAGYGKAFMTMREAALAADPQKRPMQYADMNMAADVDSQTYPTVDWLKQHLAGKAVRKGERGEIGVKEQHGPYPSGKGFVTNEYAHALENSLGNLQDYWDVFEANPMFWGGFIWEWADQSLVKTDEMGRQFSAYGGDFGDKPNDGRNCVKGLVDADRNPRPHYWEAKKVFQYIKVNSDDPASGKVEILNKYFFSDLSGVIASWKLEENGKIIGEGKLDLPDIPAGQKKELTIPLAKPQWKAGAEYFLTVTFRLKADQPWAKAGHIVAWDQLELKNPVEAAAKPPGQGGKVLLSRAGKDWVAKTENTSMTVDGEHGWLKSYSVGGVEQLAAPLRPNFWRAPTDNDQGWTKGIKQAGGLWTDWKDAAANGQLTSLEGSTVAEGAQVRALIKFPLGTETAEGTMIYGLKNDGSVQVSMSLDLGGNAKISEIPRVGVQFAIPGTEKNIRWFGRGYQETYRDRKTGAAVGLYGSTVSDWITHYVRPQENANRTDVRWIEFFDEKGKGLRVEDAGTPFGVSAWPYTQEDLEATTHDYLLPQRATITVNVDGFQIGIGGDTSWGLPVHDQYRLKDKGKYEFSFELKSADSVRK